MTPFHLLVLIVFISLAFDFTNGWHDAASSIATIVSTRVLRPLWAVVWAAFWNFVAPLTFGTAVAATMGKGLVHLDMVNQQVLLAGLLGAIIWNYATIRLGLPCSSSHALMGGYGGAAIAAAGFRAIITSGWIKPVIFIFIAPVIGLAAGIGVTALTSWIVRRQAPRRVDRWFRRLQLISAGAFSFSHGTNDAQKSMGIITAALVTGGVIPTYRVPDWVIICCALAMAGGTMAGGWRVVKTMGQRITKLNPFGGFAAETSAALTLIGTAAAGIPVSSTHVITGAISGVGATRRFTAVRWGVTRHIVWAWVLTIPGAGLMGALFHFLFLNWMR
ncbi:MAG TPA: inorganic phosphate transporter [Candidatus Polarisedimenticolia bacterium]|nr:inorganic phosphate transporter [Candidatus Polarisedimenticolia bacterium]